MTNEQVFEVIKQQVGNCEINDLGWTATKRGGLHTIELIVGSKPNPQYDPIIKPFLPEFEPDRRILRLNGAEDFQELSKKLEPILKYMPENKTIMAEQVKQPMATVSNKPTEDYYKVPKINAVESFDAETQKEIELVKGIPSTPTSQEKQTQEFMGDMMEMLQTIGKRLDNLEKQDSSKK